MSSLAPVRQSAWLRLESNPWVVIGSILAGLAVGELAPKLALSLEVVGDIYLNLLKMVVLPFIVAAVIFSLRKLFSDSNSAAILPRLLAAFLLSFFGAALIGLLVGILVAPGRHLSPDTLMAMGQLAGTDTFSHDYIALSATSASKPAQGLGDIILTLIPGNIFTALTEGDTLKVLAFSLMFGFAVGKTRERAAETFSSALETIYHACLTLTRWFNRMLPVVLFAIIASQIAKTGLEPLKAMFKFILALALGTLVIALLSLLALRVVSRRTWPEVLRSQRAPWLMAIATRNSPACMPTMITSLVESLGFVRSRIELLVPLGISLLQIGSALYYALATFFIAQLYDVRLTLLQMGVVVVGSVLVGIASSGMSGLVAIGLTGLVCDYLRLPFEAAMALFVAVDPLVDILDTLVTVAGNMAFAAMTAGSPAEGGEEVQP